MNERTIQPVGGVRASETGMQVKITAPDRTEHGSSRGQSAAPAVKPAKQPEAENEQAKRISNISIHFNVDEETERLIVVVSDRESGRVIRTIPASELEKMQAGDLLKLRA